MSGADEQAREVEVVSVGTSGYDRRDDVGDAKALLTFADGSVRFEHVCDRGTRGVIVCAPRLQIGNGHTLTRADGTGLPTVRASILCEDCGTHGWVTDGRWHA